MIRELKGYWWGDGDRPRKVNDHALDELRYFVMTRPAPSYPALPEKTVIQKDKESLFRAIRRSNLWTTKF